MQRRFRSYTVCCLAMGLCSALAACSTGSIQDPSGGRPGDADGDGIPDEIDSTPNGPGGGESGNGASGKGGGNGEDEETCTGSICSDTEAPVESSAFPRLSHAQWSNSVRELLGLSEAPNVTGFTNDAPTGTQFDNNGSKLQVSTGLWGDYQKAAEQLAADLAADTTRLAKLVPSEPAGDDTARARAFLESFGLRAYRRPLTAAELDAHTALFMKAPTLFPDADAFTAGVQLSVQAMLQSPSFIYRAEIGADEAAVGDEVELDDYAIASRLSFMVWDSMPDDELFALAKDGKLLDPKVLGAQAERLLADPRAEAKLVDFHRQLLELRNYDTMHPAGLPETIGATMREETERFVRDVVVANDGNLETLLTASYSFVNQDLADLYGLSGTFGAELERVDLDPTMRSGILTHPGFLTYRSGDTAPILRGVFLNLKLLCTDLPPPPVFEPPVMTGVTRRERINSVTGVGTCGATCHATKINPAGFPLEYFDDVGRQRDEDNGQPIDAKASFMFLAGEESYDGPIEWGKTIAASAEAHECYVRHWVEFGYGRAIGKGDAPLISRVGEASRTEALSVKDILVALVQSPSFRTRLQGK